MKSPGEFLGGSGFLDLGYRKIEPKTILVGWLCIVVDHDSHAGVQFVVRQYFPSSRPNHIFVDVERFVVFHEFPLYFVDEIGGRFFFKDFENGRFEPCAERTVQTIDLVAAAAPRTLRLYQTVVFFFCVFAVVFAGGLFFFRVAGRRTRRTRIILDFCFYDQL